MIKSKLSLLTAGLFLLSCFPDSLLGIGPITSSGFNYSEQTNGDTNVTWTNGKTTLRQSSALTANRTGTLPVATAYSPGTVIIYTDRLTSDAFGVAWSPAGSDTLNGAGSSVTVFTAGGTARFETDGVSAWTQLDTHVVTPVPAGGATGQVLKKTSATDYAVSWGGNYARIVDSKASGTNGGTFTSGAWRTRDINTITADAASITTLPGSNTFTLPAGTYRFRIRCPGMKVSLHQARLYNVTDSAVVAYGTSAFSSNSLYFAQDYSEITGRITITATITFRVEHRCSVTEAGDGFGEPSNFGNEEIFTVIEIFQE